MPSMSSVSRIVYLNREYLPEAQAKVSVFDRGFLMADAVYEAVHVFEGKIIDFNSHLDRLQRSLDEIKIDYRVNRDEMLAIHRELISRNALVYGNVYIQISRGNFGDRDFAFPTHPTHVSQGEKVEPTVVMFTQAKSDPKNSDDAKRGWAVMTQADLRWKRRDIKTVQLLYPSLVKSLAVEAGYDDVWMVEDGHITEGTSNNAFIVKDNVVITRNLSDQILHGTTRALVLDYIKSHSISIEERPFTLLEAYQADEAFVTSVSTYVMPVVKIDNEKIGNGLPGPHTIAFRKTYMEGMLKVAL